MVSLARQVLLCVFGAVALTLGLAAPSWAHTSLSWTTPAGGADLDSASSPWLFAVPAVVVGLLLAGFALMRSRRGQ